MLCFDAIMNDLKFYFCVALVIPLLIDVFFLSIKSSQFTYGDQIKILFFTNHLNNMKSMAFIHKCCRNTIYPKSNVTRFMVPDHLVNWQEFFLEYSPIAYESPNLIGKPWADPVIGKLNNFISKCLSVISEQISYYHFFFFFYFLSSIR